jgi:hypothetical protein
MSSKKPTADTSSPPLRVGKARCRAALASIVARVEKREIPFVQVTDRRLPVAAIVRTIDGRPPLEALIEALPNRVLVAIHSAGAFASEAPFSRDLYHEVTNLICREGERRGWPDGWWEDPSVLPGLAVDPGEDRRAER